MTPIVASRATKRRWSASTSTMGAVAAPGLAAGEEFFEAFMFRCIRFARPARCLPWRPPPLKPAHRRRHRRGSATPAERQRMKNCRGRRRRDVESRMEPLLSRAKDRTRERLAFRAHRHRRCRRLHRPCARRKAGRARRAGQRGRAASCRGAARRHPSCHRRHHRSHRLVRAAARRAGRGPSRQPGARAARRRPGMDRGRGRRGGVERVVLVSSIKVLGEATDGVPFRAGRPAAPADAYGFVKWCLEEAMRGAAAAADGPALTVIRPPLVYGPGVKANFRALLRLVDRGLPLPFASIANRRSLVFLDNLVDLVEVALVHPAARDGTFLLRDEEEVSTPELIRRIARALGRPARLFACPPSLLRLAARAAGRGAAADRVLGSLSIDDAATREQLGWRPRVALDDGLAATCRWYRGEQAGARPKLIYLVTEDWYFWSHRLPMARAAQHAGFDVAVATRVAAHGERIRAEGFALHPLRWRRRDIGPWASLRAVGEVYRLYSRERPLLVHHVALKPAVLGSVAALLAGIPAVVNAVTGVGFVASSPSLRARLLRRPMDFALARLLERPNSRVIVQNEDDRALLLSLRSGADERIVVIRGSGVDTTHFRATPEPPVPPVTAGYAGRMLADKGVAVLVEAQQSL